MKRVRPLALALMAVSVLLASGLTAQEAVVRSGEHASFSRLVVYLSKRVPWAINGSGREREVVFSGAATSLDLSQALSRVSRDRLSSVTALQGGAGIRLEMNCDCDVDVFWHDTAMLVIDIHDAKNTGSPPQDDEKASTHPGAQPLPEGPLPTTVSSGSFVETQSAAVGLTSTHLQPPSVLSRGQTTAAQDDAIDQARLSISTGIKRAAALGLIDAEIETPKADTYEAVTEPERGEGINPPQQETIDSHPQVNLGTYTGADPKTMLDMTGPVQNAAGQPCIADELIDIAAWGTSASFAEQIGPARQVLTEEFDRYRPDAALNLAQLYLFFGFGAEAKQVIENMQIDGQAAEIALAMAELVEHEYTDSMVFAHQMECASDAALWSTLANGEIKPDQLVNVDAILRALSRYPDHLRSLLGARVAKLLVAGNQISAAGRVLRLLDRQTGLQSAEQALVRAEVDISSGDIESADASLKEIVDSNGKTSAEALIRQIDHRLQSGEAVPPDMVDLAAAYLTEQRTTRIGPRLVRAYIGALAAAGHYELAFERLKAERSGARDASLEQVVNYVASYTVENADDLTFLKHLMPVRGAIDTDFSDVTINRIAKRLIDLGFPTEARAYLSGVTSGDASGERQTLRARVNLAQVSPRAALVDLLGMNGPDVDALRARAYSQLGEHRSAHLLYLAAGETDEALRAALLAEGWNDEDDISDSVLSADIEAELDTNPTGALARSRVLIEQSAEARKEFSSLLHPDTEVDDSDG